MGSWRHPGALKLASEEQCRTSRGGAHGQAGWNVLYVKQRVGKETSATNSDLQLALGVTWAQGELVYNLKPAVGHPWAWVCTVEGKVGTGAGPSFSELDPIVASPK